jgi:hypothetical protein
MKIKYKRIAKSLTGFSTPVFGISWNPPKTDREFVRQVITFLEDRRALYNPYEIENPKWVLESILIIRDELTDTLKALPSDSDISQYLRGMREACRKFMNDVGNSRYPDWIFFTHLGELRAVFGIHIAQLAVKYGINIEEELASIIPFDYKES